tara:strand:+ start:352 stop:573 length:222 start_codon:yes stop_codon:yes gene_type:complete
MNNYEKESPLRNCTICNKVWQTGTPLSNPFSNKKDSVNYYEDFPKYGLKKINCKKCNLKTPTKNREEISWKHK